MWVKECKRRRCEGRTTGKRERKARENGGWAWNGLPLEMARVTFGSLAQVAGSVPGYEDLVLVLPAERRYPLPELGGSLRT
jgi:hypothetical protein